MNTRLHSFLLNYVVKTALASVPELRIQNQSHKMRPGRQLFIFLNTKWDPPRILWLTSRYLRLQSPVHLNWSSSFHSLCRSSDCQSNNNRCAAAESLGLRQWVRQWGCLTAEHLISFYCLSAAARAQALALALALGLALRRKQVIKTMDSTVYSVVFSGLTHQCSELTHGKSELVCRYRTQTPKALQTKIISRSIERECLSSLS